MKQIEEQAPAAAAAPTHKLLSLLSIAESKTNPRTHFDAAKLAELTASVKKHGVLSPILVRPNGDDGYELVAGHRRVRAAKAAGVKVIPAVIREMDDLAVLECQLAENMERDDLHELEEAGGYHALMAPPHRYTAARIAEMTGRSVKYVYDRIKLLDLTKEAQALFLGDRITAGHAILLARLSPKDQERAIGAPAKKQYGPMDYSGGVFEPQRGLLDDEGELYKTRSVRELEAWIDKNVRFNAKAVDPMLFPETAEAVKTAVDVEEKIVAITREHYIDPATREGRTYFPQSWKRADKTHCEHWATGIVVVGRGRGDSFKVCVAKDKCKTHWGKEIAARERAAKERGKGGKGTGASTAPRKPEPWQIQEKKREAARMLYATVAPKVVEAVAIKVAAAPIKTLADLILGEFLQEFSTPKLVKAASKITPRGKSAEEFVRHLAMVVSYGQIHDRYCADAAPEICKALGVDLAKIIATAAPEEKKPATASVTKSKPAKKRKAS